MLGEFTNQLGERWEMQLKGSGKTPYSRRGDGRAVLRSSIREFLCSEAMFYLGVPTSRAAAIVVSDDQVIRDQFYDGNIMTERTSVVLRLAKSWFRFGSLEILTKNNEIRLLRKLVDFIIKEHFPGICPKSEDRYVSLYSKVVLETAELIAKWQSIGFTHGVCNTDNFSILSITIDYGPFGYMDEYDPSFVPNTSDDEGRYSYEKQPDVGYFNLDKLRLALLPLLNERQKHLAKEVLSDYAEHYRTHFMKLFGEKLGLKLKPDQTDHENLIAVLLKMMQETRSDFTMTFRELSEIPIPDLSSGNISQTFWALQTLKHHDWFDPWVKIYVQLLTDEKVPDHERMVKMQNKNPRYILRNWIAQTAIGKAENNDFTYVRKVLDILKKPFTKQNEAETLGLSKKPPSWASSLRVSCSS